MQGPNSSYPVPWQAAAQLQVASRRGQPTGVQATPSARPLRSKQGGLRSNQGSLSRGSHDSDVVMAAASEGVQRPEAKHMPWTPSKYRRLCRSVLRPQDSAGITGLTQLLAGQARQSKTILPVHI